MTGNPNAGGDAAWDDFVGNHPNGTVFHLSGWNRALERALRHRSHWLVAGQGSAIKGVLPLTEIKSRLFGHALISNAFAVAGGPLALDNAAERDLLDRAAVLARQLNVDYVELKDAAASSEGWLKRDDLYGGFERPIPNAEAECLTQIPRKQRAVVRKALEHGFAYTIDENIDDFFALYARTVRDHGTPVFSKHLFQALKQTFGDACEILTVRYGGAPISSVMSLYFRDKVLPYYTGSALSARGSGANDFMYWQLMRHASARGATVFDFGRSKVGTGPYAFKKNWGFQPRAIAHQYLLQRAKSLPNINPTNPKFDLLVKSWRRLPLPVANFLGPVISRNLG